MKFHFYTLMLGLFVSSCNEDPKSKPNETSSSKDSALVKPDFTEEEIDIIYPDTTIYWNNESAVLNKRGWVKVQIHQAKGYDEDSLFAVDAARFLEEIVNSDQFEKNVVSERYWEDNRISTRGLYNVIMNAHEPYIEGYDEVIDLYLRVITPEDMDGKTPWLKNCENGTIGIDGGKTGVTAICPDWLHLKATTNRKDELAAHFIHEYMHNLGYLHSWSWHKSVPYKIQFIVEKLGAYVAKGNPLTYNGTTKPESI